ncbi:MAG: hypothetical protein D6E12_17980 [Desulfovibrio sp.]|nr:MAG: hypothetical protein D6E12_17980 [Desulfovibrio sp.]
MFLVRSTCLALLACCFLFTPALAVELPEAMATHLPPYPQGEIMQSILSDDGMVVFVDCGQADMAEVVDYYVTLLGDTGFTITMDTRYQGGALFLAEKDGMEVTLDIGDSGGTIQVTQSLGGAIPQGAAPDQTSRDAESASLSVEEELAASFPVYPGSTQLQALNTAENSVLVLDCGQAPIDEVFTHYKNSLLEHGYTIDVERSRDQGATLAASKPGFEAVVDIDTSQGMTMVSISLNATAQPAADAQASNGDNSEENAAETAMDNGQTTDPMGSGAESETSAPASDSPILEQVAIKPGDNAGEAFLIMSSHVVQVVSPAGWEEILDYYSQDLAAKGWTTLSRMIDAEGGTLILASPEIGQIMIVPTEDTPSDGNTHYTLVLTPAQ